MAGNGSSGRKARPTHLRLVEGKNYRAKAREGEPKPRGDLREPPPHFDDDQKAAWAYAIDNAPAGLLKRLDQSVLAVWVVAWCLHQHATRMLQAGTYIVKTPNGSVQQSPWVGILNRAAKELRSAASDLGFSPAARTRISLEGGSELDSPNAHYFRK